MSSFEDIKTGSGKFNWQEHLRNNSSIEKLPVEVQQKLNDLAELAETEPGKLFLKDLASYRSPLLSLVQYFRDILTPEERSQMLDAIRQAEGI